MKLTLTAVLATTSLLVSTTAAFDPKRDSCIPAADTWDHVSYSRQEDCVVNVSRADGISITCGGAAIILDKYRNQIRVILNGGNAQDQSLTVHGSCMKAGKQIAHLDLHVATPAHERFMHDFHAFNRNCDGDSFVFTYYSMTPKEFDACTKQPVKPIN